ncbi:MAG TPA: hypothetical protein VG651_25175 [Stellaceae bacterium]|nr:hypothetical protein [Stellaceae bacterium]
MVSSSLGTSRRKSANRLVGARNDDGNGVDGEVLLEREIPVDRHEYVELLRHQRQRLAVLHRRPAHLAGCLYVVSGNFAR